jgi:hypothetical protein
VKAVKRWRYYCDHCKKVSGLRTAMEKHEKGCTLNPARDCGICGFINGGMQVSTAELLLLLPDPKTFVRHQSEDFGPDIGVTEWDEHDDAAMCAAVHAVLPKLRELTDDCPACILASLRQKGIPVPVITDFNFTEEMKAAQQRMNDARRERENRPSYGYGGY